ncbi:hypothetical protein ES708_33906 [subsurface metagenome]
MYVVHFNSLSQNLARRKKRIFDLIAALALLLTIPISVLFIKKPLGFIRNIVLVIIGVRTWVGFYYIHSSELSLLPRISPGMLTPITASRNKAINTETIKRMNLLYAKDYKMITDLSIILRDFNYLVLYVLSSGTRVMHPCILQTENKIHYE